MSLVLTKFAMEIVYRDLQDLLSIRLTNLVSRLRFDLRSRGLFCLLLELGRVKL